MIRKNFDSASNQGDWTMPLTVSLASLASVMTADELVEFHMAPDGVTSWDDYGLKRDTQRPRYAPGWHTFEANSQDGTGAVQIIAGPAARVIVPASVMRGMGPAMVSIGMHFLRQSTGQRVTLLNGRLPIVSVP